jgi:hypothetical protein
MSIPSIWSTATTQHAAATPNVDANAATVAAVVAPVVGAELIERRLIALLPLLRN